MPKKIKKSLSLDEELSKIQRESDKSFSVDKKSRTAFIILLAVFSVGSLLFAGGVFLFLYSIDLHLEPIEELAFTVFQTISIIVGLLLLFLLRRKFSGSLILALSAAAIILVVPFNAARGELLNIIPLALAGGAIIILALILKAKLDENSRKS